MGLLLFLFFNVYKFDLQIKIQEEGMSSEGKKKINIIIYSVPNIHPLETQLLDFMGDAMFPT